MDFIERLQKKACKCVSTYRVVAVGVSKKGNVIGVTMSTPAPDPYKYPKAHAEWSLLAKYGRKIDRIYIARFNKAGKQLSIDPCCRCKDFANRLGVTIKNIGDK